MSKFIDELNRSNRSVTPAIGFRKESNSLKKPPVLIIADMSGKNIKEIQAIVRAGVDAVIIRSKGINIDIIEKLVKNIGDIPAGLLFEDDNWDNNSELLGYSFDFVICGVKTPVSFMTENELGKILKIEPWLTPGIIRAINELSVSFNGVFIDAEDAPITIERLLVCHYISGMIGKPLLSVVKAPLTQVEVQGLYEAGVRGLLLSQGVSLKELKELKDLIVDIPMNSRKKTNRSVLLPSIQQELEPDEDDED